MKKLKKQATAFLLAFLMIFSCLPSQTISATDTVTDTVTAQSGTDAGTEEASSETAQTEQDLPGTEISLGSAIMGTTDVDLNAQITSASAGNTENTEAADSTATGANASVADNAETGDNVGTTDSTGTGNSAGTADSTDTTSSTETNGNATATDSTESGNDAGNIDSTENGSDTGDAGSTESSDSTGNTGNAESNSNTGAAGSQENSGNTGDTDNVENSGNTGDTDNVENSSTEDTDRTENSNSTGEAGSTDASDSTEDTGNENAENGGSISDTDGTEDSDNTGDTGDTGSSDNTGDVDGTEDSDSTEDTGSVENSDNTVDSENTDTSDDIEYTDSTDPNGSTTDADDTEASNDETQADGEDPEAEEEADLETEKETDEETEEGTDEETEEETDEEVDEETLAEDDFDGTYVLPGEQYYEDGWASEILAEAYAEEALFLVTVSNIRLLGNSGISLASEEDGENGEEEEIMGVNWSFDIYYVNQDDPYYVEKTSDFSLKYQMEFHTSETLAEKAVEIKIPYALLTDRDANPINPSDIAVPHAESRDEYVYNASMPFNWTVETIDGVEYLVFFNYREITAGTNVAWQVLYKNLQVMDIVDMTEWELQAEISVEVTRGGEPEIQPGTPTPLTGLVDTYANLASVSKNPLNSTGVSYTPGLYTANQLSNYITWWVVDDESEYLDHMDDYVFVVWDVKIKGNGTQPYDLAVLDTATATKDDGTTAYGTVIGYQAVSKSGYTAAISEPVAGTGTDKYTTLATNQENSSWGTEFYVVTAYSLADLDVDDAAGILMSNDIQVRLEPADGIDDPETLSDSASWSYQNYEWIYQPGDIIGVTKKSNETLKAWLEAYQNAVNNGTDLDGLSYTTTSQCYGYEFTHVTDNTSADLGEYIPGTWYRITTVDDFVYAYPSGGGVSEDNQLNSDDYYFSKITVSRSDKGMDVWEDQTTDPEHPDGVDQNADIYVMYDGATDWTLAATIDCSTGSSWSCTLGSEIIAKKPWRVKVVYNSVNYYTTCTINVTVALKGNSKTLQGFLMDGEGKEIDSLQVENISGVMGQAFVYDEDQETSIPNTGAGTNGYFHDSTTDYGNYSEYGLEDSSNDLYGTLPMRDSAIKTLTGLNGNASSYKTSSTQNDADNSRTLITYNLTAYDGYEVTGSSLVSTLKSLDVVSPSRNYVVFYDLLPYGMQYDASYTATAGRIASLSGTTWQTQYKSWDTTQVEITDVKVDANWRGTGRTMVAFHIYYSGSDSTSYSNELWYEGWGVNFRAYYDWSNLDLIGAEGNANIAAFMPDAPQGMTSDDPEYEKYMTALIGLETEVACDDGVIVPTNLSPDYNPFRETYTIDGNPVKGDLNDDGNIGVRNVLYAKDASVEEVAVASYDTITKTVRADANASDEYGLSAHVAYNGTYTYNITVNTINGLTDLVLFDRLEYAAADTDQKDSEDYDYQSTYWTGTFVSVDTTGLELMGIAPTVYYNADRDAAMPGANDYNISIDGDEGVFGRYITKDNGWYTAEQWVEDVKSLSDVKAIAIDCRYTSEKGSDDNPIPFELGEGQSVSYQIRMQAPADDDAVTSATWVYDEGTEEWTEGSQAATYAYNNSSYYSKSSYSGTNARVVGNTVQVSVGGTTTLQIKKEFDGGVPSSLEDTEFTFTLYLSKGQTATESVYFSERTYTVWTWNEETGEYVQESGTYATDLSGTMTLKGSQMAVFENVTSAEVNRLEVEEAASVFWEAEVGETEIKENGDDSTATITVTNTYRPVLYVQKLLSGVPSDVDLTQYEFTMQVQYLDSSDGQWKPLQTSYWYVDRARTDGASPSQVTVTLTDGSPVDSGTTDSNGTFTISYGQVIALFMPYAGVEYRIVETGTGEDWICRTSEKTGVVEINGTSETITNIYKWKDLKLTKEITHQDEEGVREQAQEFTFQLLQVTTTQEEDGTETTTTTPVGGKAWYLVDSSGNAQGVSGTTDENGTFTVACGGCTVIIEDLEAETEYMLKETASGDLYTPVNDSVSVTMPLYSTSASVTVTNDWLKRPLSVTKYVAGDTTGASDDVEFTMTVTVGEKLLANFPYTVTKNGTEVSPEDEGEFKTDANGTFTIKNGWTVTFTDAGELGDAFEVTETDGGDYTQLYPLDENSDPKSWTGTLTGDGSSVTFVNGTESGTLMISKSYTGANTTGEIYVEALKEDSDLRADAAVTLTMTADGASWPKATVSVQVIDTWNNGNITNTSWVRNSNFTLKPGETLVIPSTALTGVTSYTLTESVGDQHKVLQWQEATDDTPAQWVEISQSYPENDSPFSGTVEENPVVTLVNTVEGLDFGSLISKYMSVGSYDVPTGAELVWKVEQYDGSAWSDAEGVRYLIFDEAGIVSTQVMSTDFDGLITITKTENGYPSVQFLDETVYVNLYDEDDIKVAFDAAIAAGEKYIYRVVEVMEESDDSWGFLAGYNTGDNSYSYDITLSNETVTDEEDSSTSLENTVKAFVNSNSSTLLKIEKEMDDGSTSDDSFTYVLNQVLSMNSTVTSSKDILATTPGVGIEYTVYDTSTGTAISIGVTTSQGRFTLKAGQYAIFDLPDGTVWTVEELSSANYTLYDLTGTPQAGTSTASGWVFTDLSDYEEDKDEDGNVTDRTYSSNLMLIRQRGDVGMIITATAIDPNVAAGADIDKNNLVVTAYYSDGSSKELVSEDFKIEPTTALAEKGPMDVTITYVDPDYGTAVTTVTLNVVKYVAFAIYSETDNSLRFYKRPEAEIPGEKDSYNDLLVTKVYTGFEEADPDSINSVRDIKWYNERENINIVVVEDVICPLTMDSWFYGMSSCTKMDNLGRIDTSQVVSLSLTFSGCTILKELDLSGWNTSNVTKMNNTFYNCAALGSLTMGSQWSTDKVETMERMFYNDKATGKLNSLDVSGWNTENVKDMSFMFYGRKELQTLDVSGWVTDNVNDMKYMFYNCENLTYLDVSKWNVNQVTSMFYTFANCKTLAELDVSKWLTDGNSLTDLAGTFKGCSKLKKLDVSKWDVSKVGSLGSTFSDCKALETLDVSNWNVGSVSNLYCTFYECKSLQVLDVSRWDVSNLTTLEKTFYGCENIEILDVEKWNTESLEYMQYAFYGCTGLVQLNLKNWTTSKLSNMNSTFYNCSKITELNLESWDTSKVWIMSYAFTGMSSLAEVTLGKDFKFPIDSAFLPTQAEPGVSGADGNWYTADCIGYTSTVLSTYINESYGTSRTVPITFYAYNPAA